MKSLNFIYFTTITSQVIQLIYIMLVGTTDVCVRMVFVWEETGGNTPVWLGDHMTISHVGKEILQQPTNSTFASPRTFI